MTLLTSGQVAKPASALTASTQTESLITETDKYRATADIAALAITKNDIITNTITRDSTGVIQNQTWRNQTTATDLVTVPTALQISSFLRPVDAIANQAIIGYETLPIPVLSNDTVTTAVFTNPAAGGSVAIEVADVTGYAVNQVINVWGIILPDVFRYGSYSITGIVGNTITGTLLEGLANWQITVTNTGESTTDGTVPPGARVTNKSMLRQIPATAEAVEYTVSSAIPDDGTRFVRTTLINQEITTAPELYQGSSDILETKVNLACTQFTATESDVVVNAEYSEG